MDGAPRQRGQRGLDWRTKAVPKATARALAFLPASNMWSTVSRTAGTLLVRAQISLSCTPWRARGQHGTSPIAETRYCLGACARAALRTSALSECCATAVAPQIWAPSHASRSRRSSRLRPIGKLRQGRDGQATQTRRRQLVQDKPIRSTRHHPEAQHLGVGSYIFNICGEGCRIPVPASHATSLLQAL